jgi:hypothetical protein
LWYTTKCFESLEFLSFENINDKFHFFFHCERIYNIKNNVLSEFDFEKEGTRLSENAKEVNSKPNRFLAGSRPWKKRVVHLNRGQRTLRPTNELLNFVVFLFMYMYIVFLFWMFCCYKLHYLLIQKCISINWYINILVMKERTNLELKDNINRQTRNNTFENWYIVIQYGFHRCARKW